LEEKSKKLKELNDKITAINKQKSALMKETSIGKEKIVKEIITNQKKINELEKKLGIAPIKKEKPATAHPKPKADKKKIQKIAKKAAKIVKKVEQKKKEEKKKEKKDEKKDEKGFFNIGEITQNITNKINDITKCVIDNANEITNKITGKIEIKDIKLKAAAPQKEEKKKIHQGIHCNGCGMNPIEGNRFKCAVCENFDYCEKCESLNKDLHLHPFIKIYSPETAPIKVKCDLK